MTWLSTGLGAGLGFSYILASYANARFARSRRTQEQFIVVFLGGMAVRMAVALALMGGVLALVPVRKPVFIATFLAAFFIGFLAEVAKLHREAPA